MKVKSESESAQSCPTQYSPKGPTLPANNFSIWVSIGFSHKEKPLKRKGKGYKTEKTTQKRE